MSIHSSFLSRNTSSNLATGNAKALARNNERARRFQDGEWSKKQDVPSEPPSTLPQGDGVDQDEVIAPFVGQGGSEMGPFDEAPIHWGEDDVADQLVGGGEDVIMNEAFDESDGHQSETEVVEQPDNTLARTDGSIKRGRSLFFLPNGAVLRKDGSIKLGSSIFFSSADLFDALADSDDTEQEDDMETGALVDSDDTDQEDDVELDARNNPSVMHEHVLALNGYRLSKCNNDMFDTCSEDDHMCKALLSLRTDERWRVRIEHIRKLSGKIKDADSCVPLTATGLASKHTLSVACDKCKTTTGRAVNTLRILAALEAPEEEVWRAVISSKSTNSGRHLNEIDHRCNRFQNSEACVLPDHFILATHKENMKRASHHSGRYGCFCPRTCIGPCVSRLQYTMHDNDLMKAGRKTIFHEFIAELSDESDETPAPLPEVTTVTTGTRRQKNRLVGKPACNRCKTKKMKCDPAEVRCANCEKEDMDCIRQKLRKEASIQSGHKFTRELTVTTVNGIALEDMSDGVVESGQ